MSNLTEAVRQNASLKEGKGGVAVFFWTPLESSHLPLQYFWGQLAWLFILSATDDSSSIQFIGFFFLHLYNKVGHFGASFSYRPLWLSNLLLVVTQVYSGSSWIMKNWRGNLWLPFASNQNFIELYASLAFLSRLSKWSAVAASTFAP